ncbi:MAG: ATP synthase subunit C [Acholeplasmataceae bacterium]|nr:ATP synthase subunit C [Acholeplasmataceae bacterium]
MLNAIEIVLPLLMLVLISIPLIKVFKGNASVKEARSRLLVHISGFFGIMLLVFVMQMIIRPDVMAAEGDETTLDLMTGTLAQGLGFISAALATGMSALGAGIAVAAAAPAAIGAFSENEKNFGKSLIFVALGEGVAIYGLLISILIINKL